MTGRELTARYEADNPIDPAVVEVKSADGDVARHAFTPHGTLVDRLRDESYQDIVAQTVNNSDLDAYVVIYRTYILHFGWKIHLPISGQEMNQQDTSVKNSFVPNSWIDTATSSPLMKTNSITAFQQIITNGCTSAVLRLIMEAQGQM